MLGVLVTGLRVLFMSLMSSLGPHKRHPNCIPKPSCGRLWARGNLPYSSIEACRESNPKCFCRTLSRMTPVISDNKDSNSGRWAGKIFFLNIKTTRIGVITLLSGNLDSSKAQQVDSFNCLLNTSKQQRWEFLEALQLRTFSDFIAASQFSHSNFCTPALSRVL
jgi:hypothetical protein